MNDSGSYDKQALDRLFELIKKRLENKYSVTARARMVEQPRGGYVSINSFEKIELNDALTLFEKENVHGSIIGMAVDYLTRFMLGEKAEDAFCISLSGARIAEKSDNRIGYIDESEKLLAKINKKLDDETIISACKLSTFDVWYRNHSWALKCKDYSQTNPDADTINNIKIMIQRVLCFWDIYGPIVKAYFDFKPISKEDEEYNKLKSVSMKEMLQATFRGGYSKTVVQGDGDYLTKDTIWELKVLRTKPTKVNTLQLMMYWIMGQHSKRNEFENIDKIGIFNPRFNTVYLLDMNKVSKEIIKEIEDKVICY